MTVREAGQLSPAVSGLGVCRHYGDCFVHTVCAAAESYEAEEELEDSESGQHAIAEATHGA